MKVSVELSREYTPPRAVIYADAVTEEIQRAVELLGASGAPIVAQQDERIVVIRPEEVWMIRVEGGETAVYTQKDRYCAKRRLYELLAQLGGGFMQINRQCAVNLACVRSVEASFGGALLLKLKNGLNDSISRKYQPQFRAYLGI